MLKYFLFILPLISFTITSHSADLKKEQECFIAIQVIENYNNEPNVDELYNTVFGGSNKVQVIKTENSIATGVILNKNGGQNLQVLINWNYVKKQYEFVSATLVGPVRGYLQKCKSTNN